jgi:hypothetical protein
MMTIPRTVSLFAAVSMSFSPIPASAETPGDLDDLVGVRGSSGEDEMISRGYYNHHTAEAEDGKYSYWWNQSKKTCARVFTSDGRYQKIKAVPASDCGQKGSGGDKTAAIAIGAAALIGVAALASKSHHRGDRDYDTRGTADFERGYRDGLYSHAYYNYGRSDAYSDGYSAGVKERGYQTPYRDGYSHNAGYSPYSGYQDVVGHSNDRADSILRDRGYAYMGKDETGGGHERTYWNAASRQCISVRTSSGNVVDAHSIKARNCR